MNKKFKFSKKKIIIILALILIIAGIIFLINKLAPVENVTSSNIDIKLSTTKLTGDKVTATVATNTKHDIYYYVDEKDEEAESLADETSEIYEETLNVEDDEDENTSANTDSNSSMYKSDSNEDTDIESSDDTNTTNNTITNTDNTSNQSENTVSNKTTPKKKDIKDEQYTQSTDGKITVERNSTIYLKFGRLGKLSNEAYTYQINNIDKTGPEVGDLEVTTTDNSATVNVTAFDLSNSELTYYFKLADDEEFISNNSTNSYTFTDLEKDKTYIIYVKVEDKFGNATEAATDATLGIAPEEKVEKKKYHFKVNLGANTVTVYEQDENGEYTKPVRAMICSTGISTPKSGTYKISYRYRWLALFGNVYGQYAVRIHGNILFHSVPYLDTYPNTLEYEEYDKLGTKASAGCIRLKVIDAKWIYDNASTGSTVEFYSDASNPGPLGKPNAQKISGNKSKRNWDPTDPDPRNPWTGGSGEVSKTDKKKNSSDDKNKKDKKSNKKPVDDSDTIIWDTRD